MDIFNLKKIEQYKIDLKERDSTIAELKEKIEKLNAQIKGERVTGPYCKKCKNSVEHYGYSAFGLSTTHICLLDCKCKDFKLNGD